uniref:NADH dehydrogenase subunit 6 n=1 Tax=Vollenhovia emeryi TaxID=411798 RepID=A0A166ZG17_VOLEM|nr:NADH dehydrogenase subunit 6 [Vollenhovia emeryi]ANA91981.1 NADH dehydrogenase subunit 6 [Vollenhovia emeryi]
MMNSKFLMNLFIMIMFLTLLLLVSNYTHPITMMLILLMYTLAIIMLMSMWSNNYLFSILMFLMMISGLFVIFLYFSSLIMNEQYSYNFSFFLSSSMLMNMILFIYLISMNLPINLNLLNPSQKFMDSTPLMNINSPSFINIMKIYMYPLNNITILTMFYLLLALFSIIKICSLKNLALRKISSYE